MAAFVCRGGQSQHQRRIACHPKQRKRHPTGGSALNPLATFSVYAQQLGEIESGRQHFEGMLKRQKNRACLPLIWRDDQYMSSLKTILMLLTLLSGGPVTATSLPQVFAGCTGRYSAELEHAWLVQSTASELLEARRARFEDLLAAVSSEAQRKTLLDQRIRAKTAHAHILGIALFSRDPERARWARRRAAVEIGYCESFLLEG